MIDGVLLLDKPVGPSSSRVLGHVKRLIGASKAGHGGTLDPLASGLLPIMFGESTKYAAEGLDADKTYEALVVLGVKTATADAEGAVIESAAVPQLTAEQVRRVLDSMQGVQMQIPPMFSALKKDGRPLYDYARKGQAVDRMPRQIQIHRLELLELGPDSLRLRMSCSKGTYVRTFAEDLACALGTVGHLAGLRRVGVGSVMDPQMVSLHQIESARPEQRLNFLKPVDWLIRELATVTLGQAQSQRFLHGQSVMAQPPVGEGRVRVYSEQQEFLGTGIIDCQAMLSPDRVRVLSR